MRLEEMLLSKKEPYVLQTLVKTLFKPHEAGEDVIDTPLMACPRDDSSNLVNLFTPEFCLQVGDTFVTDIKEDIKGNVSKS